MRALLFLLVTSLLVSACGPGVTDTTYRIADEYFYSDAGGLEKMIIYRGTEANRGIVIDARVDRYRVEGSRIVVARRPRLISEGGGISTTSLSSTCEHWVIDMPTHQVAQIPDTAPEAQLTCNSPFDQEFNPER
jgi:hypothetical protein